MLWRRADSVTIRQSDENVRCSMGLADVIDDDPAKLQALLEKFVYIDKDGDGAISLEELQEVYPVSYTHLTLPTIYSV